MPKVRPIDVRAVNRVRQEIAQVRADFNRRLIDLDATLEAMLPPDDDRRARRYRRYTRNDWDGFLDGKKAGPR